MKRQIRIRSSPWRKYHQLEAEVQAVEDPVGSPQQMVRMMVMMMIVRSLKMQVVIRAL
ncbi:hypothetical protein D3C85_1897220 [compost metagenome]